MLCNPISSLFGRKAAAILAFMAVLSFSAYAGTAGRQQAPDSDSAIDVIGNVSDENGEPLPGATILLKGNNDVHAIADIDGNYSLTVPDRWAILEISYIGFISQEIQVGNRRVVNVVLAEDIGQLQDAVVVAYGQQKKESVVASIAAIEPEKLKVGTSRSLSNNLAGTVAGVLAVQRSGEPGYDNSTFWIRGISTFQDAGRDPLVLVDGIERDINNIDPEEIASFSVLKDAAASAVYGVRGANGVILIQTKRGEIGKPRVTIKAEFAGTTPVQLPDYIGAADYMQLLDDIRVDGGMAPMYTDQIAKTRAGYDPDLYPDVDWIDAVTKDWASNQRVTAEVSGGNNILTYSLVAAFYNEQGILTRDPSREWDPSIKLQRYNVRSNVDINITKTTKFRVNIGGYLQDRNSTTQSTDLIFSRAFRTVPFKFPVRYSTGEIPAGTEGNPWAMATQYGYQNTSSSKIETLFSLEQDLKFLTKGLRIKGTFSFDRYSSGTVSRSTSPDLYNPATQRNEDGTLVLNRSSAGSNTLGHSTSGSYGNRRLYLELALNYDRTFAGKHAVSGMLLAQRSNYDDGSKLPYRNQGMAGRAAYTFDDRYVAEFNFGYNGSENFAPGKRYGFFPSAAIGWVISEEPFMARAKRVLSTLKIRASYGQTGNADLSGRRFAYLSTITDDYDTLDMYKWGIESAYGLTGMAEGDFAVPDLTWEKVNKANIGLELGFFDGVFDMSIDVFDERRNNIFMERTSIPLTAGFIKTPWQNYGKVKNQGAEVTLNFRKQFRNGFFIGLMGTFTYAHNEIVEMDEPASIVGTNRAETGHPVGQIFGYIDEGLYTEEDFIGQDESGKYILNPDLPQSTLYTDIRPGDIKYKDVNGDGKIDVYDQSPIGGTNDPEIVYGFGLNLAWKGFDFGVLFQGAGRMWRLMSNNTIPGYDSGGYYNVFSNYQDRWTVDNPSQDVFYPRLTYGPNTQNAQPSTWWLKNMSYLRLKNIELGWSIPQRWADRSFISGARVFLRGTNVLTFSGFKLWDPELDSSDGGQYPLMKSFSAGVEFKF